MSAISNQQSALSTRLISKILFSILISINAINAFAYERVFASGFNWPNKGPLTNINAWSSPAAGAINEDSFIRVSNLCTGKHISWGGTTIGKVELTSVSDYYITCQSYYTDTRTMIWVKGQPGSAGWDGILQYGLWDICELPANDPNRVVLGMKYGVVNIDKPYCASANQLSLTPAPNQTPPDPRPKGIEGKDPKSSTHELIAKVTENGSPKAGVAVSFKVDVVPMTGGHGHHDASRPKGSVPASGVTNVNGEIKLTFQASDVAGSYTITATCDSCSNKTADKKVDVLVPDLQPVSANPPRNQDGTYAYSLTAVDATHVGTSGGRQRGEYYLTQAANQNLRGLIEQFADEGWGTVALNDASLNWGGVYDIFNSWHPPHSEHRVGEEIDISFTRAGNPISQTKQNEFYKKFCEDKKAQIPFSILHHYIKGPHFHVRLVAANRCGKTPK